MTLVDIEPFIKNGYVLSKYGESGRYIGNMSLADVPIVDAEPIVRCKDCVHRRKIDCWCSVIASFVDNDEFYCAEGIKEYEDLY